MRTADSTSMRLIGIATAITLAATCVWGQEARDAGQEPSQRQDPLIQNILEQISEERIAGIMQKLGSFETRNTVSDPSQTNRGIGVARQWIFDQFKSYSPRLQVSFDTYNVPKTNRIYKAIELRNVVAILPGTMKEASNRWILVSGHYDSINVKDAAGLRDQPEKAAELPAPGVSDDASGTACAMECARVLSQHDFDATLVFVAFAGEEEGLYGAKYMARRLRGQQQEIEAVLDNDIIGTDTSGNGLSDNRRVLLFSEDPNDSSSRSIARFVRATAARYYPEMVVDLIFRHDRFQRGGDHTAFNQVGYAGVRFTTPSENFANQHSATDTFANASPGYAARVVRINAAAAAEMALAPGMPVTAARRPDAPAGAGTNAPGPGATAAAQASTRARQPGLTRGASGYDAVLRWEQPDPEPDLAGFIVVVRSTTAADWEREIWVGNVREFTMKNTPIDQLVFGVKAVDREGHESPVSAYVTQPSAEDAPLPAIRQ
jgi:Peptidase family M28